MSDERTEDDGIDDEGDEERLFGPVWLVDALTDRQVDRLLDGRTVFVAGKAYRVCGRCRRVLRADGWFGGWHVCR